MKEDVGCYTMVVNAGLGAAVLARLQGSDAAQESQDSGESASAAELLTTLAGIITSGDVQVRANTCRSCEHLSVPERRALPPPAIPIAAC